VKLFKTLAVLFFVFALFYSGKGVEAGSAPKQMLTKRCMNCHTEYKGMKDIVTGTFKSRSNKAKTIQVRVNNRMELLKFTPETTIENVPNIKALKEPMPLMVHYKKVGDDLVATDIVVKPKMEVPKEQLIEVKELSKLVAMGPEKGGYMLIDSRPGIKFNAGHIPTSLSIPFPKMKKMKDTLPKDKNTLVIFYCEGFR
jgi:hypothetical protein